MATGESLWELVLLFFFWSIVCLLFYIFFCLGVREDAEMRKQSVEAHWADLKGSPKRSLFRLGWVEQNYIMTKKKKNKTTST